MKHTKLQAGFTLIELIAVMVILAILAAVVIPRITSVQEGAYESNVGNMYGAIRNYISNQALKNAISGGRGMEVYDEPTSAVANHYLDLWIKDYDRDKWKQTRHAAGGLDQNPGAGDATPDRIIFQYHPHGVDQGVLKDIYFIEYFPASTSSAQDDAYQYDSFQLVAYRDSQGASGHDCDNLPDVVSGDVPIEGMIAYRPEANSDTRATDRR